MEPTSKVNQLRAAAAAGDWQKAIRIAARFPVLGDIRGKVLDAHMAYTNPRFAVQLGKDIEAMKAAGIAALTQTYIKQAQ